MFKRSFRSKDHANTGSSGGLDAHHRVEKSSRLTRKGVAGSGGGSGATSARDPQKLSKHQRSMSKSKGEQTSTQQQPQKRSSAPAKPLAPSPIVTLTIGAEGRLFAAHEDVLCQSPFFEELCRGQYLEAQSKRIALPEEEPEVFSGVLEYLYKGDYYPRLLHNKHRNSWELEDSKPSTRHTPQPSPNPNEHNNTRGGRTPDGYLPVEATVWIASEGQHLLRDTAIYCAAGRYGLEELQRLALRKQGLQAGIDVGTILRSARYCYAHTPDSDSRLRAHYLALIIRCRRTFKRSGTMQAEMERGGEGSKMFFDLFVAMCNHLDEIVESGNAGSPRLI